MRYIETSWITWSEGLPLKAALVDSFSYMNNCECMFITTIRLRETADIIDLSNWWHQNILQERIREYEKNSGMSYDMNIDLKYEDST